jgi:NO-binding membrane sensor protein with MHYT domain
MLTVWNCIAHEHDPELLALAVAICALSSFTAISLLHHVRRCELCDEAQGFFLGRPSEIETFRHFT